jgi:hypothetical protein
MLMGRLEPVNFTRLLPLSSSGDRSGRSGTSNEDFASETKLSSNLPEEMEGRKASLHVIIKG